MHNFKEADELLTACEGRVQVQDADGLAAAFEGLLRDPAAASGMGSRARKVFLERQGAVSRCAAYLKELLA